jgi:hypothetical protein
MSDGGILSVDMREAVRYTFGRQNASRPAAVATFLTTQCKSSISTKESRAMTITVRFLVGLGLGLLLAGSASATSPDANLYTTYYLNGSDVELSVCGSTTESSGCYGGGSIGPFGLLGALIEGNPAVDQKTSTVTRYIYALDIATGSGSNGVTLYVYKKTDVITATYDSVTVTLFKTIPLSLTGGLTASASMAANPRFLFIGTNQSTFSVSVRKSNFAITESGSASVPVSAITADAYGFVTVAFGDFAGFDVDSELIVYGPDGNLEESGAPAEFMVGTQNAVLPNTLPVQQ